MSDSPEPFDDEEEEAYEAAYREALALLTSHRSLPHDLGHEGIKSLVSSTPEIVGREGQSDD